MKEARAVLAQGKVLRDDQSEVIQRLDDLLAQGKTRIVVQAPTGYGKTILAAAILKREIELGKRVLFSVPALSLIDQSIEAFQGQGLDKIGVIQAYHEMTNWDMPVQVASIQTLQKRNIPPASVVIIDEIHKWFRFYEKWFMDPQWKDIPIIGLSATPWTKGLGAYFSDLLIAGTTASMIDNGLLSDFKVFAPSSPDLRGVRTVAGDYHEGDLSLAMNKATLVADIVETWKRLGDDRATLCFAVDRAHAKSLQNAFLASGVSAGYQDSFTKGDDRRAIKAKFHSGDYKIVCNVGTLTTGTDWNVHCIILARPTKSEILFCLDCETEILTSHGWCGIGQVRIGDCAAALTDPETGRGCWSRIIGYVERAMEPSEQWVSYQAPRANFRVTDGHTMVFRTSRDRKFLTASAEEMATYSDGVQVPSAIEINQPGVPLTDAELYFIGMMMTDGTWTPTAGSISQSERHPEIIERIEQCLTDCGIGYAKTRIDPPPLNAAITEKYSRWRYSFSAGKPKPHHNVGRGTHLMDNHREWEYVCGITGYRHLLPFMDKDFAPALMAVSRQQFLTLLQGIHDGDGFKMKSPSIDWTPRSWTLCSGRAIFAGRLQALAAINGFTANLRSEKGIRKNPIWFLTITPQAWRSIGGSGQRPQITMSQPTDEKVWCVQTEAGTIVTRRKGKVTVMGNCQIVGRGLRTAEGKDFLTILDHSDNHLRLGFVTDILYDTLHDGKKPLTSSSADKILLPKKCPQCSYLKPPKTPVCPSCGFKAEARPQIEILDGDLIEIKRHNREQEKARIEKLWSNQRLVYGMLLTLAKMRGKKLGWAYHTYRDIFKAEPPIDWNNDPPTIPDPAIISWVTHRNIAYARSRA